MLHNEYNKQPFACGAHISIIRDIVQEVADRGYAQEEFCKLIGLDTATLRNEDCWVSSEAIDHTWLTATEVFQDPYFGMKMGSKINRAVMSSLIGYLMQSCPNLLIACHQSFEFQDLLTNMFTAKIETLDQHVEISFLPQQAWREQSPEVVKQLMEYCMIHGCSVFRVLSGKVIRPLAVYFAHTTKKDIQVYQKFLGENLYFGQTSNKLIFALSDLLLPVISANALLKQHFENLAQQLLLRHGGNSYWTQKVLKVLQGQSIRKLFTLNKVADVLNLAPRSLQRKLKEEQTSFQAITSQVQQQRTMALLKNGQLRISEIAYMLGYAEPGVFTRAFKSWTGKTPKEYLEKSTTA